jgi:hypothetical protein
MAEFYEVYRSALTELGLHETLEALEEHRRHRPTESSLSTLLQEGGFEVVENFHSAFVMRFADGSTLLRHHFIRLGFLPDWADLCPTERRQEVFQLLEARLNQLGSRIGGLALSVPMICVQARKAA